MKIDKKTGVEVRPCKYCKTGYPVVFPVAGDLYYARCDNPECHRWDLYEFCATTTKNALLAWNSGNSRPMLNQED